MTENVVCGKHGRSRLAKFCEARPVKDAFGNVIRTQFICRPGEECDKLQQMNKQMKDRERAGEEAEAMLNASANGSTVQIANITSGRDNKSEMFPSASSGGGGGEGAVGKEKSDVAKIHSAGAGRYYDLSNANNNPEGGARRDIRLCFGCGLEGHDKNTCPNTVCRRCRVPGCRSTCATNGIENGVNICTLLGAPGQSEAAEFAPDAFKFGGPVRCTLCHQDGHMDCVKMANPARWVEQCIVCAGEGHSAFKCPDRRKDFWSEDMKRAAAGTLRRDPRAPMTGGAAATTTLQYAGDFHQPQRREDYSNSNNNRYAGGGGVGGGAASAGGSGSGRNCFSCGAPGHMSRDCPQARSGGGGGGGGGGGRSNSSYQSSSASSYQYNNNYNNASSSGDRRHGRDDYYSQQYNGNNNNNSSYDGRDRTYNRNYYEGGGGGGGRR